MGENADDEAWLEEELARQLAGIGPVEVDEEEDFDGDTWALTALDTVQSYEPAEPPSPPAKLDSPQAPDDSLQQGIADLMKCLQEVEGVVLQQTEESMQAVRTLADEVEQQLRAPKEAWSGVEEGWDLEALNEEDKLMLDNIASGITNPDSPKGDSKGVLLFTQEQIVEEKSPEEAAASAAANQESLEPDATSAEDKTLFSNNLQSISPKVAVQVDDCVVSSLESPSGEQVLPAVTEEEQHSREYEMKQIKIEQEHKEHMESLEKQQMARIEDMRKEEELWRIEQERSREEMAMFSEELRLVEFYDWERSNEQRD